MTIDTEKTKTTTKKMTKKQKKKIQLWKNIFHYLSMAFVLALIFLGLCVIMLRNEGGEDASLIYLFIGALQVVWCIIIFVVGVLLPKEGKKLSPRAQKVWKILASLVVLSGRPPYLVQIDYLRRYWEPAFVVPGIFFEGILFVFFPSYGIVGTFIMVSMILYALLLVSTLGWSIMFRKETDTFSWVAVFLPTVLLIVIFGGIVAYTHIKTQREGEILQQRVTASREASEETLAAYTPGSYDEEDIDISKMTMDEIFSMVQNDTGGDVSFFWVPGDEADDISLLAWSDSSEDVYVTQWKQQGDTYSLVNAFISPSMTKEDVEGKEQGVIPAPAN